MEQKRTERFFVITRSWLSVNIRASSGTHPDRTLQTTNEHFTGEGSIYGIIRWDSEFFTFLPLNAVPDRDVHCVRGKRARARLFINWPGSRGKLSCYQCRQNLLTLFG